jgi:hypothetical protein
MSSDGGAPGRESRAKLDVGVGFVLADAYEITHLLGKGGMGAVWGARHLRLPGKRVAIKVLLGGTGDAQALARFRREAEIASRIGHAGIVEVLDFNELPDGTPYQVLEYLVGESLGARLARGPLPVDVALDYARQIGSALAAAHRAGVVHRDLKPENIFLCPTDAGGVVTERVKVLDFGISKIRGSQTVKTQDQVLIGTPQYMAPEQASGNNATIDARTDLFALGAIVYEMLAGRPAFSGESVVAVIMNVIAGTPTPLPTLVPGLAPSVVAAIERALAKKPDERFPDVATFIEALTGKPLQTLGGGETAAAPAISSRPPLSREELMAETMAPAAPGAADTGGAPKGASPVAVPKGTWQLKSPVPFIAAFMVLGAAAYVVSTKLTSAGLVKKPAVATSPAAPPAAAPLLPPPAPVTPRERLAEPSALVPEAPRLRSHPHVELANEDEAAPDDVRADLEGAEAALARGDTREAKRLAQHSLLGMRTSHAFSIVTRAACRDRDLTNARAGLRNVSASDRPAVLKACAATGLDLK